MSRLMDLFPQLADPWENLSRWVECGFEPATPVYAEAGYPALNIFEKQDQVFVEAELPGVMVGDIDISVTGQEVVLSGQRKAPSQPETTWTRQERPFGGFSRTITLPWEVDPEHVSATLRDGVLTVGLTKSEKCRTRKVAVKIT